MDSEPDEAGSGCTSATTSASSGVSCKVVKEGMSDRDGGGSLEAGVLDWAENGLGCWDSIAARKSGILPFQTTTRTSCSPRTWMMGDPCPIHHNLLAQDYGE